MSACIYDMDIYVGKERMHDCRCDSDSVSVRYLRRMLMGYGHKLCIDNFFFSLTFLTIWQIGNLLGGATGLTVRG